jgi:hypothetical protein
MTIINAEEIPADLAPGTYCCRLDESTTLAEFRIRFVMPSRIHQSGDCLVQIVKHPEDCERCAPDRLLVCGTETARADW